MQTLKPLLPSVFTTARIVCGLIAVMSACNGMRLLGMSDKSGLGLIAFDNAAKAIGWAILFDSLDGKLARWLDCDSPFGREFDSLADVVTFGMAPAILLLFWGVMPIHEAARTSSSEALYIAGWIVASMFLICGAARLARFNLGDEPLEESQGKDGGSNTDGLPIPGAAGVIAAVVHFTKKPLDRLDYGVVWLAIVAVLALLMTSRIRYKPLAVLPPGLHKPVFSLLFACLLAVAVWIYSEQVLLILALAFAGLSPFANVIGRPQTRLA
jgi:CDP-diacylglycerol--serine O-phosphatidyltransferase